MSKRGRLPKNTFISSKSKSSCYKRYLDLTGQVFGYLTVLNSFGDQSLCRCKCGVEKTFNSYSLKFGVVKSCGCYKKETKPKERIYKRRPASDATGWRLNVFKRDDFTCQLCLKRGGSLEAHHIMKYADHEHLRLSLGNGITLCSSCHSVLFYKEEKFSKLLFAILHMNKLTGGTRHDKFSNHLLQDLRCLTQTRQKRIIKSVIKNYKNKNLHTNQKFEKTTCFGFYASRTKRPTGAPSDPTTTTSSGIRPSACVEHEKHGS